VIDPGLAGAVVVVTGANNSLGIGAGIARAFAAQGARVFLHYLRRPSELAASADVETPGQARYWAQQAHSGEVIAAEIRAAGGEAVAWEGDLADPATVPRLFGAAEAALGPVSVLVNNAAHSFADTLRPAASLAPGEQAPGGMAIDPITAASHDQHFAVNSRATALMMADFARRHAARGGSWGRIVNVSTDGASAFPGEVSYGASKHAMESYSRAAALELGRLGITVNVVSLGPVQTGWIPPEQEAQIAVGTPLGRVGQHDDVADVVVFLASRQARWLTGQLLYVGGGHTMPR
jgi:3-oxoacyl-[acyl-carrier protein] reductase